MYITFGTSLTSYRVAPATGLSPRLTTSPVLLSNPLMVCFSNFMRIRNVPISVVFGGNPVLMSDDRMTVSPW